MDATQLQIIGTVLSFVVFLGILAWAYSGRQASRFVRDAQIPFEEDVPPTDAQVLPFRRHDNSAARHGEGAR